MRVNRSLNRYRHSTKTRPTLPYLRGWAGASVISVKTALPTQGHPAGNTLPRTSNPKPAGGEHSMLRAEHAVALRSLCGDLGGECVAAGGRAAGHGVTWTGGACCSAHLHTRHTTTSWLLPTHTTTPWLLLTPPHHGYYWFTPPHHGYWHSTNPFQETKNPAAYFLFLFVCVCVCVCVWNHDLFLRIWTRQFQREDWGEGLRGWWLRGLGGGGGGGGGADCLSMSSTIPCTMLLFCGGGGSCADRFGEWVHWLDV